MAPTTAGARRAAVQAGGRRTGPVVRDGPLASTGEMGERRALHLTHLKFDELVFMDV